MDAAAEVKAPPGRRHLPPMYTARRGIRECSRPSARPAQGLHSARRRGSAGGVFVPVHGPPALAVTVLSGRRRVSLHRAVAGRTVSVRADLCTVNLTLDGHVIAPPPPTYVRTILRDLRGAAPVRLGLSRGGPPCDKGNAAGASNVSSRYVPHTTPLLGAMSGQSQTTATDSIR